MNAVASQTAEYELVMMLDPEVPDERRDQIATGAQNRIEGAGDLKHERAWGMRKLAYEIRQRTEADYRFFRFGGESSLLEELDHNLKITDGVLRFRIFRVDPDSPLIEPPPPVALASSAAGRGSGGRRGGPGGRPSRPPEGERRAEEASPDASASEAATGAESARATGAESAQPADAEPDGEASEEQAAGPEAEEPSP
jgi:small subunit ribosomal protein S6